MIDLQSRWARNVTRFLDGLGVLLVVAACLSVLYYWDPTRTYVKRWQEPDPNVFERVDSALLDFRVSEALSITTPEDIERTRAKLTEMVWGRTGVPPGPTARPDRAATFGRLARRFGVPRKNLRVHPQTVALRARDLRALGQPGFRG